MFGKNHIKHSVKNIVKSKEDNLIHQIRVIQDLIAERLQLRQTNRKNLKVEEMKVENMLPDFELITQDVVQRFPSVIPLEGQHINILSQEIKEDDTTWKELKDLKLKLAELQGELMKLRSKHALLSNINEKESDPQPSQDAIYESLVE